MTKLRNTPTGWDAFRAFRQTPAPEFHHRHGNWKHGHYSKQSIADARELRLCIGTLRGRFAQCRPRSRSGHLSFATAGCSVSVWLSQPRRHSARRRRATLPRRSHLGATRPARLATTAQAKPAPVSLAASARPSQPGVPHTLAEALAATYATSRRCRPSVPNRATAERAPGLGRMAPHSRDGRDDGRLRRWVQPHLFSFFRHFSKAQTDRLIGTSRRQQERAARRGSGDCAGSRSSSRELGDSEQGWNSQRAPAGNGRGLFLRAVLSMSCPGEIGAG